MKIRISLDNIKRGLRAKPGRCAAALAIRRVLHAEVVYVSGLYVSVLHRGRWYDQKMDAELRAWIRRYDEGLPVEPYSFELHLPQQLEGDQRSRYGSPRR